MVSVDVISTMFTCLLPHSSPSLIGLLASVDFSSIIPEVVYHWQYWDCFLTNISISELICVVTCRHEAKDIKPSPGGKWYKRGSSRSGGLNERSDAIGNTGTVS